MNKRIKQRLLHVSIPSIAVLLYLYAGLYWVWTTVGNFADLCEATAELQGTPGSECSWISNNSVSILGFIGVFAMPSIALILFLLFSQRMRLTSIENELKMLRERSDV